MKTIAIGDIHGRGIWQYIIQKEDPDRVIFIGDYFDSFDISYLDQMYNFKQIVHFKKTSDKEVILLKGNHCLHYDQWARHVGEVYSGYQSVHSYDIMKEFEENEELFQIAHKQDKFLFVHAGITAAWLKDAKIENNENLVDNINELYKHKPNSFAFGGIRARGYLDPYGDNYWQSPVWVRPRSLMQDSKELGYVQVVGHTTQNCIDIKGKSTGGKYYFIDTLGTSGEYLIIEDGEVKLGTTK